MKNMPLWAAFLALGLLSACTSANATPEGDSGPASHPACGRPVGVPRTSAILAVDDATAPNEPDFVTDPWSDSPGTGPWQYAHQAFPAPVTARWIGTTRTEGMVALHFEVDGDPWTLAVEQSAPIPSVPEGGVEVELTVDADRLAMSRVSDGAMLLAWIRVRQGVAVLAARDEGEMHLALGDACVGSQNSGFDCDRHFLVYDLDVSAGSAATSVSTGATGTLEVDGASYTITNRLVSQRGGAPDGTAVCADLTPPAFDADVVIDAL